MSHHVSSCLIMSHLTSSHFISFYLISSHLIRSFLIRSHHVSTCLIMSHHVLSGVTMSHHVSLYLIISHLVSSHHFNRIPSHRIISYISNFSISYHLRHPFPESCRFFNLVLPLGLTLVNSPSIVDG